MGRHLAEVTCVFILGKIYTRLNLTSSEKESIVQTRPNKNLTMLYEQGHKNKDRRKSQKKSNGRQLRKYHYRRQHQKCQNGRESLNFQNKKLPQKLLNER